MTMQDTDSPVVKKEDRGLDCKLDENRAVMVGPLKDGHHEIMWRNGAVVSKVLLTQEAAMATATMIFAHLPIDAIDLATKKMKELHGLLSKGLKMIDWDKNNHKTRTGLNAVVNRTTLHRGITTYSGYVWDDYGDAGNGVRIPGPMVPRCWWDDGKDMAEDERYDLVRSDHV